MKTLYVSDMDGTLLGPDSKVSPESAAIISDLSSRGALITVATARTAATVAPLLADTVTLPPAIVMTGAAFWDRQRSAYFDVRFLSDDAMADVVAACHSADLHPFVYMMEDERYLDVTHDGQTLTPVEQAFYDERSHLPLKRFHLRSAIPHGGRTVLIYAMGAKDAVYAVAERLASNPGLSISCYQDIFDKSVGHLEIFEAGVSKASAVLRLKEMVKADRLVVFGDNLNDLPMMEVADVAVAVGNAFDAVKEAADIIIGPNSDDSVARFILADYQQQSAI